MFDTAAIALRPHHVLCLLTFAGDGYSADFVRNFGAVVERIGGGSPVRLVEGPDDVCAAMPASAEPRHCVGASVARRDRSARAALAGFEDLGSLLAGGTAVIDAPLAAQLRAEFAGGRIRRACAGCEWSELCTTIAAGGFGATALAAQLPAPAGLTETLALDA